MIHRLSYSSVTATLALLLAIGGTSAVGAQALLTGKNVKDDSLTGADIQNDSLTGADVRAGSLGSNLFSSAARANLRGQTGPAGPKGDTGEKGEQGPAGVGITVTTASGADVTNYQDFDTLATAALPSAGDVVVFASITAHNTGTNPSNLNCFLLIDGNIVGGGGGNTVNPDESGATSVVGAMSLSAPTNVALQCQGGGGTTWDLSNIKMRTHNLG